MNLTISVRHRLRFISLTLAALAAGLGLWGCGGSGGPSPSPGPSATPLPTTGRVVPQPNWSVQTTAAVLPQKKWTVLVYLNGANDLEVFGTLNVNQMEMVGSGNDVNIVVQFKRIKGQYDTSDGDWGGTRRYYVQRDNDTNHVSSTILSTRDGLDMGQAQTLQDFVQWGTQTYPADRMCLVVWNHGAGWRSQKLPTRGVGVTKLGPLSRGVSYDDEFKTGNYASHIETIQMANAIDMGGGRKWDLLTLDCSLMQMAEVAYEVRDKAFYIVGSEESPPGEGYPYDKFLADLTANPSMDGKALGVDITSLTYQEYQNNALEFDQVTQSVLDTSKIAAIAPAVDALGSALSSAQGRYGSAIANARNTTENYDYPENSDLLDFVHRLIDPINGTTAVTDSGVQAAGQQVRNAVNAAVITSINSPYHAASHGLAIYLPTPSTYRKIDVEQADGFGQRYSALSFAKAAPNWQAFLVNGPQ